MCAKKLFWSIITLNILFTLILYEFILWQVMIWWYYTPKNQKQLEKTPFLINIFLISSLCSHHMQHFSMGWLLTPTNLLNLYLICSMKLWSRLLADHTIKGIFTSRGNWKPIMTECGRSRSFPEFWSTSVVLVLQISILILILNLNGIFGAGSMVWIFLHVLFTSIPSVLT